MRVRHVVYYIAALSCTWASTGSAQPADEPPMAPVGAKADRPAPLWKASAIYAAGFAPDLAVTEWALSEDLIREGNPLMQRRGVRLASWAAQSVVCGYVDTSLRKRGHKRTARWFRAVAIGARLGVAVLNYRTAKGG